MERAPPPRSTLLPWRYRWALTPLHPHTPPPAQTRQQTTADHGIDRSPPVITRCSMYQHFTFHLIIHSSTSVTSFPLLHFFLLHVQSIQGGRSQRVKTSHRGWDEILVQIVAFHTTFCSAAIITCWYNICIAITVILNSSDDNLAVQGVSFIGNHRATR